MRKTAFLMAMLIMLLGQIVSAQEGYPTAYETVYSAPEAGMLPLNTPCTLNILVPETGVFVPHPTQAKIEAYIVWVNPARPADYYVTFTFNNAAGFVIYSRDSLSQLCH